MPERTQVTDPEWAPSPPEKPDKSGVGSTAWARWLTSRPALRPPWVYVVLALFIFQGNLAYGTGSTTLAIIWGVLIAVLAVFAVMAQITRSRAERQQPPDPFGSHPPPPV